MKAELSNPAVDARPVPVGAGVKERPGSYDEPVVGMPFEALFDATRIAVAATRDIHGDKTSPTQMFESNMAGAHLRRQKALHAEYRSELTAGRDRRLEQAQEASRRAPGSGHGSDTRQAPFGERGISADMAGNSWRVVSGRDGAVPGQVLDRPASDGALARVGDPGTSLAEERSSSTNEISPNARGSELNIQPVDAAQVLENVSAAGAGPSGVAKGGQAQTPAQQIAQILGAGRLGEAESARAAGPSPGTTDGRPSNSDSKSAKRPGPQRQGQANASAREGGVIKEGADATERSEFDRVVRSMRLRVGARRSSARFRLDPPELGRLRVDVRLDGDRVRISVRTQGSAARDIVSGRAARLTAALQQHGIAVEQFDVTFEPPADSAAESSDGDELNSETPAERGSTEPHMNSLPRAQGAPTDEAGPTSIWDLDLEIAAAGETRLDIRV